MSQTFVGALIRLDNGGVQIYIYIIYDEIVDRVFGVVVIADRYHAQDGISLK
jgi:hypothetical protein